LIQINAAAPRRRQIEKQMELHSSWENSQMKRITVGSLSLVALFTAAAPFAAETEPQRCERLARQFHAADVSHVAAD
jgi:hypothetical protein